MYIVQKMAVDVIDGIVRNVGDELTKEDVLKIDGKRLKSLLATHRIFEIENMSVPETIVEKPKAKPKAPIKKSKEG